MTESKRSAVVTGASRGLGLELTRSLAASGWSVVVDARDALALSTAVLRLENVTAVPGDVADPAHRRALVAEAVEQGDLTLLINNASLLGPSPLQLLVDYPLD